MWLFWAGFFIQCVVLLSILCVLLPPGAKDLDEVCVSETANGPLRCVLLLGQSLPPEEKMARAKITSEQDLFQWNGLFSILAGTPGFRMVYDIYPNALSVLSNVDSVVYVGPEDIEKYLSGVADICRSFTFPSDYLFSDTQKRIRSVFDGIHQEFLTPCSQKSLTEKTIFIIYLSSIAAVKSDREELDEAENVAQKGVHDLESTISSVYPDNRTVFIAVPDLSPDRSNEVLIWGRGVAAGYHRPVRLEDLCPLIASLLGVPIPLRSVGVISESFMNLTTNEYAKLTCNAMQLCQLANVQHMARDVDTLLVNASETRSRKMINECSQRLNSSRNSMDSTIFYFILFGLIGWIFVIISEIMISSIGNFYPSSKFQVLLLFVLLVVIGCTSIGILFVSSFKTYRYILFYYFPLLPWFTVAMRYKVIFNWLSREIDALSVAFVSIAFLLIELILYAAKYELFASIGVSGLGLLPMLTQFHRAPYLYSALWTFVSSIISLFLLLDQTSLHSLKLTTLSGIVWVTLGGTSLIAVKGRLNGFIAVILTAGVLGATVVSLISYVVQVSVSPFVLSLSWLLLMFAAVSLFCQSTFPARLVHMCLGFAISLILTSKHHQPLVYLLILLYSGQWIYLERSYLLANCTQWDHLRRGVLLYFTCIVGYLLMGRLEYTHIYEKSIMLSFTTLFNQPLYYFFLSLRYLVVFISIAMINISLINYKLKSDVSFVYTYLFAELVCLRCFVQFYYFGGNMEDEIFNHLFSNVFTIFLLIAHAFGSMYSAPLKDEDRVFGRYFVTSNGPPTNE